MIPVNEPVLTGNELKYLEECIKTGWISSEGRFVTEFEEKFSKFIGKRNAIAVANGSVSLEVAVAALNLQKGDEVILPSFTIISCIAPIIRSGATPVLVDADPVTWNMDVNQVEAKITSKTKAIMVVHIYGLPVDMDSILYLAEKYQLKIIEDAAEAIGQEYNGKKCGSFGDISSFSFYPNKHITTGEGGMLLTDDDVLAKKMKELRNLCFIPPRRFIHHELGWNFRMSNLQAALGVAQLERINEFILKKRDTGKAYNCLFENSVGFQKPSQKTAYAENIYWVYGVVLNDEVPFDAFVAMEKLKNVGIGTRPFFYPLNKQPILNKLGYFADERYPIAEKLGERGFYLPSGLGINEEQIYSSAKALISILEYS